MSRSWLVCALIGAVACTPLPCAAQSALPIAVDQRVRLWTDAADAVVGRVAAVTPQSVQIAAAGVDPITVATPAVRRVEVSRGTTSRGAGLRKGALRGALILGVRSVRTVRSVSYFLLDFAAFASSARAPARIPSIE